MITLAIIGVVAALTIPSIVRNYQKTQTVTQLKKIYSSLNQAVTKGVTENGNTTFWDNTTQSEEGADAKLKEIIRQYFIPYLRVSTSCMEKSLPICKATMYNIDGTLMRENIIKNGMILNDGTSLSFGLYGSSFWIWVDINGQKAPNVLGKDIFLLGLDRNKNAMMLWGQGYNRNRLTTDSNGWGGYGCIKGSGYFYAGGFCGALIMLDGWQIKDDYPW